MTVLQQLACFQNRRDERPNQELAREIAASRNKSAIREIAGNLTNRDRNIQSDCLKVLYEVGLLEPELIAGYAEDFIQLLKSRNNRMVWGAMIALSSIAALKAELIFARFAEMRRAMEYGSVITVDHGILALARAAGADRRYADTIFPYLINHLKNCRPKEVALRAEKSLPAVDASNKAEFLEVLEKRMEDLSASELARVRKVMKQAARL